MTGFLKKKLTQGALGGLIVFKRNVDGHAEVADLLAQARAMIPAGETLLTAVDQEGGRVVRLGEPLTHLPPARFFGELDDVALTQKAGVLVGKELRALGFNLDFAPVLDVDTNPGSPVIGDRSYGPTVESVIRHGLAFGRGLARGGVCPCAKHFPGHGDTELDSHLDLPRSDREVTRLEAVEMAPFAAWAGASLGPVMTAHVIYTALDPDLPATLSQAIVQGELRQRIGFLGAVVSDDLEMGAMAKQGGPARAAVRAVEAGVDGLLVCRGQDAVEAALEALVKKGLDDAAFVRKLDQARRRLSALCSEPSPEPNPAWIGSREHLELKAEVALGIKGE